MMTKLGWILALTIALPVANAAEQTFKLERGTVKIDVPADWKAGVDFMGVPLALLGPEKEGSRPVINITATGANDVEVIVEDKAKEQKAFKEGRVRWLASVGGKALQFYPYKNTKWNDLDVHTTGYRYQLGGSEFVEHTYFVVCNKSVFHITSLATQSEQKEFGSTFERSIRSFSCK